jgi:hypothetical protein
VNCPVANKHECSAMSCDSSWLQLALAHWLDSIIEADAAGCDASAGGNRARERRCSDGRVRAIACDLQGPSGLSLSQTDLLETLALHDSPRHGKSRALESKRSIEFPWHLSGALCRQSWATAPKPG